MSVRIRWTSSRIEEGFVYALMGALAILVLFPFYWMLIASTRATGDLMAYPPHLTPGSQLVPNLEGLFATLPVLRAFFNSSFIAVSHTVLVLFFCSLGGFGF